MRIHRAMLSNDHETDTWTLYPSDKAAPQIYQGQSESHHTSTPSKRDQQAPNEGNVVSLHIHIELRIFGFDSR